MGKKTNMFSINEKETVDAIHASLKLDGVKITKSKLDKVLDKAHDLTANALVQGFAVKVQDLGSLEIRTHEASSGFVPDVKNPGSMIPFTAPAGRHVKFVMSEDLAKRLNTLI